MKNILFIFSDQQRQDTMGCYGQKLPVTPNLDILAKEGSLYENAYTPQPVCGPARSCLQTGKYPTEIGTFINGISLKEDEKTIAKYLNEVGYQTAYIGKWHLASDDGKEEYFYKGVPKHKRGGYKDYWMASDILEFTSNGYEGYVFNDDNEKVEFKKYRVDAITDYAIDFLDKKDNNKPFFMFLSYIEPHHQNSMKTYQGPMGSKDKFADFTLPKDLDVLGGGDSKDEYADYLGCCNSIDNNVGRIVEKLKENGEFENTIIIYTSDHGCHFKTRNKDLKKPGGDDYKRSCHEGVAKVPLIIHGLEGIKKGRIKDLVSLIDLPKTILEIAKIKDDDMQGESLLSSNKRDNVFIQISESIVGRAIRTKRYKYCMWDPSKNPWKDSKSQIYEGLYLYDLKKDPYELYNLAGRDEYKTIERKMKEEIYEQIRKYEK